MIAVQSRLQGAEAAAAGVVRIGAPDGFGVGFLAPRLADLAAATRASASSWCRRRAASRCRGARPTSR